MHFINHTEIQVQKSMLIGCGGKGTEAIAHCRDLVLQTLFNGDENRLANFNSLRFAVIDSTEQRLEYNGRSHHIETIPIASNDIGKVLDDPDFPASGAGPVRIRRYMPADRNYKRVVHSLPDARMGNSTCPPLGSMNFLASWENTKKALRAHLQTWQKSSSHEIIPSVAPDKNWGQIFIVASLYGGTGSGVHIHLAALLRELLAEEEISPVTIYGIFLLPDIVKTASNNAKRKLRSNAYACLKEIDHFMAGNPYILEKGNSAPLIISNGGSDVLFNKVFLVNDKNSFDKTLSSEEVPVMVGELLFHFSSTTLGPNINQRLIDDANTCCEVFAPEGNSTTISEKRRTAYSTFGLATTRIPYAKLKNNLIIDFAREVVNDLLLLKDHDTPEEREKIKLELQERKAKYLQGERIRKNYLESLGLSQGQLNRVFNINLPSFMGEIRPGQKDTIADYMKKQGMKTIVDFCEKIRSETSEKVLRYRTPDNEGELEEQFLTAFQEKVDEMRDKLLEGGGPELCELVFDSIHKTVRELSKNYQQQNTQGDPRAQLKNQLDSMVNYQVKNKGGLFNRKNRELKADNAYRKIKAMITTSVIYLLAKRTLPVLAKVDRLLQKKLLEVREDKKRFESILLLIEQKEQDYSSVGLVMDAVQPEVMEEFILKFQYPAGCSPEDVADELQERGLAVSQNDKEWLMREGKMGNDIVIPDTIPVSDFPEHPELVANLIVRKAAKVIAEFGEERWCKSFIESGLYPPVTLSNDNNEDALATKIPVDAYNRTFRRLVKRSDPYLEYQQGEKFQTCDVTFVIRPTLEKEGVDLEHNKWNCFPWPGHDRRMLRGVSTASPYSLTCLQFHFGLPLYSIDEIEGWKAAYEEVLRTDDRPLHKFDLPMKDPYINVTGGGSMTESDVRGCYEWALTLSKSSPSSPVFLADTPPILNALEKESCKAVYYELDEKVYIELDKLQQVLISNHSLLNPLTERVKGVCYQLELGAREDVLKHFLKLADRGNKVDTLCALIKILGAETLPIDSPVQFEAVSPSCRVYIDPSVGTDNHSQNILRQNFVKPLAEPQFRKNLTRESILQELNKSPAFKDCFFEKCMQTCNELRRNGVQESEFPEALREPER